MMGSNELSRHVRSLLTLFGLTPRQLLVIVMVQIVTLTFGMTITAANVVLPQMRGAFSASQDQIALVVTFFLVAAAVGTPLTGWMAGKLGWRWFMASTTIGFTVSSGLCGLAPNLETLVFLRVAQGFFGAPLMPLSQGILLATFPRHMHPLVLMLWGVGGVMGPVLGPIFGGFLAEWLDWRWAFFMIVPLGCIGVLLALFTLRDQEKGTAGRLDYFGFLSLAIAVGATQLLLDRGHRLDWFGSAEIVLEAVVAVLAFYLFIVHTYSTKEPFISPALFRDRNFSLGVIVAFAIGALSFTPIVLFPPLLQDLRAYPEATIGYLMSARGIGNFLSFLVVVQFVRISARLCLATGLGLQVLSGWAMAQLDINVSGFDVFWTNLLQGFGFGLSYTPLATLAFCTLGKTLMTEGSAIFNLTRSFGSSVFISLSVLVLMRSSAANYSGLNERISVFNDVLRSPELAGSWSAQNLEGLAALTREVERQSAMVGYLNAFYLFTAAAAITIPLVWLFRPPKA